MKKNVEYDLLAAPERCWNFVVVGIFFEHTKFFIWHECDRFGYKHIIRELMNFWDIHTKVLEERELNIFMSKI